VTCLDCGKAPLTLEERGLTRKLINRGMTDGYCIACLARRFRVTEDQLHAMAEAFRDSGCTLFR